MYDNDKDDWTTDYEFHGHWWWDKTTKEKWQIVAWTAFLFLVIVFGA
jgi:hypothetical protein